MNYSDQVCAKVAERYGVPVLCDAHFLPRSLLTPAPIVRGRRKMPDGISDEDTDRIITMRKQGASYRQIAKEVGRSVHGVYRIAYLWG